MDGKGIGKRFEALEFYSSLSIFDDIVQVLQENDLIVEGYEMRSGEKGTFIPLKNGIHALNIVNQSLGMKYRKEVKFIRFWPTYQ